MIHPRMAFRLESILFFIAGMSYLLFPSFNSHLIFGDRLLRSAEPIAGCMMSALGGACLLLACTFCTASETATQNMCLSVAAGHLINSALKIFSFISGWSGDVRKGAVHATTPAVIALVMHTLMAVVLWLASTHPAAKKTPLHGTSLSMSSLSEKLPGASSLSKEHTSIKEH